MEAEVARLAQQSAELQGKIRLTLFDLCFFFARPLPYISLPAESLAQAQRERDEASRRFSELKDKLDSANADAGARADDAARAAREEADKREKADAHRLGAVANSLAGSFKLTFFGSLSLLLLFYLLNFSSSSLLASRVLGCYHGQPPSVAPEFILGAALTASSNSLVRLLGSCRSI